MSLLQMSFFGAVLIIVIAAIRAVTINRLPKKTFLILWGIVLFRLLIPYSVPSVLSVYTWANTKTPVIEKGINRVPTEDTKNEVENVYTHNPSNGISIVMKETSYGQAEQTGEVPQQPVNSISHISITLIIWVAGMVLGVLFFTSSYLYWHSVFQTSLPIQNAFVEQWQKTHLKTHPVLVRQSDRIAAPLSYGIIHPVILMPKKTDWGNTEQLQYVLLHEYVHICRHDSVFKLIAALALCVHWFNPLVWVMYILLQRDIELACDESVVRRLGEASKKTYANMLIDMEARKSGLMPLCNNFSKNAIEERIIAIMKIKKTSVIAIMLSVILIVGVTAAFATSASANTKSAASENVEKAKNNNAYFSKEEIDRLLALQFDGYEDMSVSEYQNKVWELTDTKEYRDFLERVSQDTVFYEKRDSDELAAFVFYTLEPLTAEQWQTREFGGVCTTDYEGVSDNAVLEYSITLDIQNAEALTVKEYNNARTGIMNDLQGLLQDKTVEQLQSEAVMQKMFEAQVLELEDQWGSENLKVTVDFVYMPLSEMNDTAQSSDTPQEQEPREYPNATMEDYRSLLALKTSDYQKMTVADFNRKLLEWANENYERMERIGIDAACHDITVDLTAEELAFVTVTVQFSGMENGAYVRSNYTGKSEVDPGYGQYLPQKTKEQNGRNAWCDLYYQFSYHITDKEAITVEERDRSVSGMMEGISDFWDKTSLEALLEMTEEDIEKVLDKIAAENSNDKITIAISKDQISFDCMNELDMEEEGYKTGVVEIGILEFKDTPSNSAATNLLVNIDALKVREEASTDAAVVNILKEEQQVMILSEEKGFYHIYVPGEHGLDGWVRKEYVTVQ